ncbi:RNA-binding protein 25 [Cephus cinctus]|uniref:RNA-binding protein 25 n=1 Tax=Cephus cinctus TaxID=211228 RepID=A0AAJ7C5W8_CEPCN|nr:RNA-binding protein 25 [Cephus cinctus]XP_015602646.1 RNA-binding protein 25 [Cephus cinctus]
MRERVWLLLMLYGLLLASAVSGALKATRPKFKIATTSTTTTEEPETEDTEVTTVSTEVNATTGHTLTGIPQIDYIWDPNLPRELNGYNLSEYPFYNSIPEEIDFKCDGLHDGFYASVPHKCQVYHHCLFGTRYDFLCANFTAFDQKTFICHFASEVDCANSKKYWHRNDALYQAATTTTTSTTTTTTQAPATAPPARGAPRDRDLPGRRRPPFRRRPAYDYYDDYYYDDDFDRPKGRGGYDRREEYDYEDRKFRRDRDRDRRFRDRDVRDRDVRDRDAPRTREPDRPLRDDRDPPRTREPDRPLRDDRDREMSPRERYPPRSNRRDPVRGTRDPVEEEPRSRTRDPEPGTRSKEVLDDPEVDDRRTIDSRSRDTDDRRYPDKRHREEYDDKDGGVPSAVTPGTTEGLVKPNAPSSSVYARPRVPPKIRRPVPLSEQEKYAYKVTAVQPTDEIRRRPADIPEDDYYEEDLEEVRPRRPMRRRPAYRDRDRDFYDVRDRDRPLRSRYRDEEDDLRLRKYPERSRDRYYDRDRSRDRSLDRGKERVRPSQDSERSERPYTGRTAERDREDRPRLSASPSSSSEVPRRSNIYDRSTEKPAVTTTTVAPVEDPVIHEDHLDAIDRPGRPSEPEERPVKSNNNTPTEIVQDQNKDIERPLKPQRPERTEKPETYYKDDHTQEQSSAEQYSSEYYDEPEDPPAPSPRTTVRIVKRPFLPSRGGNPNPRGLLPVGNRSTGSARREEDRTRTKITTTEEPKVDYLEEEDEDEDDEVRRAVPEDDSQSSKQPYDAYKAIQSDLQQKQRPEEPDNIVTRPSARKPLNKDEEAPSAELPGSGRGSPMERRPQEQEESPSWNDSIEQSAQDRPKGNENPGYTANRGQIRHPSTETNLYSSTYKTDDSQDQSSTNGNFRVKQRINEVTHPLQDIPESEYDITLNDALTPTLNQESSLSGGFVLPLHRQLGRDTVLQSSENNYQFSRPTTSQQQLQQQHHNQQQKPFVPSTQYVPSMNERPRTVYFRTPETIHISGSQYRTQRGGPWHDYTGY